MENRNWRQNSAPKRTIISSAQGSDGRENTEPLQCLNSKQIAMIDEALQSVGDFGEVRLIIEKGRLRFLITQVSYDALKWQPGVISE